MNDDFNLYLTAQKRYGEVTDAVLRLLADGDALGLLEVVANIANGCDYVDDESIAAYEAALRRVTLDQAVLDAAERWETELNRPKGAHASYSAARRVAAVDALEAAVRARREAQR